jgi:hypothetical protein
LKSRAALAKDWRRWMSFVEAIAARRRSSQLPVDRREYETLHHRLITMTKELAGSDNEAIKTVCREIEAMVGPWMSVVTLEKADGEILSDLLAHCRRIAGELEGSNSRGAGRRALKPLLLFVIPAAVAFVALWFARGDVLQLATGVENTARMLWRSFWRLSELEQLLGFGVILILVSIYNVSRAARS